MEKGIQVSGARKLGNHNKGCSDRRDPTATSIAVIFIIIIIISVMSTTQVVAVANSSTVAMLPTGKKNPRSCNTTIETLVALNALTTTLTQHLVASERTNQQTNKQMPRRVSLAVANFVDGGGVGGKGQRL